MHGYILVYSIASLPSLEKLCYVYERLLTLVGPDVPCILVGNKCDIGGSDGGPGVLGAAAGGAMGAAGGVGGIGGGDGLQREVSFEQGRVLGRKWRCPFLECSAKTGHGVSEAFERILRLTAPDLAEEFEPPKKEEGCAIL